MFVLEQTNNISNRIRGIFMKKQSNHTFVYSTNPNYNPIQEEIENDFVDPSKQDLRITIQKLKGNKKATIIYQFKGSDSVLEELAKVLKTKCGVGGTSKNGEIILQGDCLEKVKSELSNLGYKFKVSGV